jgi:hypothetical protein
MTKPEDCPVTTIAVRRLQNAIDLKKLYKGYRRIAYEIFTLEETLKYGESADEDDAERIYRQIWQFPGWPTSPAQNTAGCDILDVVKARPFLTKDDLGVRVWDLRDIPCQNPYRPHKETLDVEGELIKRHIEQYKKAPIGNKVEQKRLEKGVEPIKKIITVAPGLIDRFFKEEK